METLKIGILKKAYHRDSLVQMVLDHLAKSQKNPQESDLDVFVKAYSGTNRNDFVKAFKILENCGCGIFKAGRRGFSTRMEWTVSIAELARKIQEDKTVEVEKFADVNEEEVPVVQKTFHMSMDGLASHPFRLRPELNVVITLPDNLTVQEAERISCFIRTLPI